MDFKKLMYSVMLMVLSLGPLSCQQNKKAQKTEQTRNGKELYLKTDSIVFKTSSEKFTYLAERLYPKAVIPDSMSIKQLVHSNVLAVEEVGDTVFVFMTHNLLHNQLNLNLPPVNDSLFQHYYPKYYQVVIDDDIPYMVYLKSKKEFVQLTKSKKGVFYWETAAIKDTVMSFFSGIKTGMERREVFSRLNLPNIELNKSDFSLILCDASVPSKIWFKQIIKSEEYLKSMGYGGGRWSTDQPNIQILFHFKNDKLDYIYLSPWIGYGNKAGKDYKKNK